MLKDEYIFQEMLEQKKIAALHKTLPRPNWPPVAEHIILTLTALLFLLSGCWQKKVKYLPCRRWKPARSPVACILRIF
jgi:hypothetical protein